jgi:hypothetical protein
VLADYNPVRVSASGFVPCFLLFNPVVSYIALQAGESFFFVIRMEIDATGCGLIDAIYFSH